MAAGSIMSPVILQHSGIGPDSVLGGASVPSRVDLPIGMNLVDQTTTTTNWQFSGPRGGAQEILFPRFQDMLRGGDADRLRDILSNDLGRYAQDAVDNGAATNATALRIVLELQRDWILNQNAGMAESFDYSYGTTLGYDSWFLLPFGRGSVRITGSDAYAPPSNGIDIDPRYFSNDFDRLAQGAITRYTREITYASPLNGKITGEGAPGRDLGDLDAWADWAEANYRSNWHPIGTVAMMSREMGGCVDSDYQVVSPPRSLDGERWRIDRVLMTSSNPDNVVRCGKLASRRRFHLALPSLFSPDERALRSRKSLPIVCLSGVRLILNSVSRSGRTCGRDHPRSQSRRPGRRWWWYSRTYRGSRDSSQRRHFQVSHRHRTSGERESRRVSKLTHRSYFPVPFSAFDAKSTLRTHF